MLRLYLNWVGWFVFPLIGQHCSWARQQNCNLETFQLSASSTGISDDSGKAMVSVLKENLALQHFSFEASETLLSDSSGLAFASSIGSTSLRSFCFVASFSNISDKTCQAMAESAGTTHLTSIEFIALHVLVSEETSIRLRNALQRNASLQFIKFETCQLDGDHAYSAVQEAVQTAMQKNQQRCECKPGCPCFQLPLCAQHPGIQLHSKSFSQGECSSMLLIHLLIISYDYFLLLFEIFIYSSPAVFCWGLTAWPAPDITAILRHVVHSTSWLPEFSEMRYCRHIVFLAAI